MMNLKTFLNYFDFDYEIEGDEIRLVDLAGANLGDIESERFPVENLSCVVDRLDIYYEDYFDDLSEILLRDYNIKTDNWKEIYNYVKELKLDLDILPYIMGDKELIL